MKSLEHSGCNKHRSTASLRRPYSLSILVVCVAFALGFCVVSPSRMPALWDARKQRDFGLPELHKINSVTLGPSYSCQPSNDSNDAYAKTALFVSKSSRDMNSPELLFDGACRGADFFQSPGNGGDTMNLIQDMGEISLEDATAQSVFLSRNAHFDRYANIQLNHTYAVLINESIVRGLVVFTVVGHIPHERLDLRYAVKEYEVLNGRTEVSPGFDWGKGNL